MMWIAMVYLKSAENNILRRIEITSRKKYNIDDFLLDVHISIDGVIQMDADAVDYEIIRMDLEHYVERVDCGHDE